ncbi:SdrD B-like domain-containing protein, partial [Neolewinella persica]|uniref:SdrD B-like domain-containing protein n=1 Tax=Neolewinella persica TaxID=70998 RepID=UPI000477B824
MDSDAVGGQTGVINLVSGENDDTNDAGFYMNASLGDYVWEDTNGNGINDEPASAGIDGVTVNLKDDNGNVIGMTMTMNGGFYEFTDLTPGTYSVQFVLPGGYTYTTLGAIGSNETNDSDADPAMNGMTDPVVLESGDNNEDLDAGIQRVPSIEIEKTFVSAVPLPNGTYNVTYTVDVINTGGIGTYSVIDTPSFDDDVTINSGSYSGADAGALEVMGATTLTTNNMIAADATETFTLVYNVTLDTRLTSTDGGDNIYTECGTGGPNGNGLPGEGLYNLAELDVNSDGSVDDSDDACGDLPLFDLALDKNVVSVGPYQQGSTVTYIVTVTNEGDIDAANVEITDTPQPGLVFSSITPQAGITSTGNGGFTVASLPNGGAVTVTLNYTIGTNFQGTTLNNAAEITEDGPFYDIDSDPETGPDFDEDGDNDPDDDDEDNVDITIEQVFDLALRKTTISAGPYTQGSTVTYQLEVINQGSIDATNVELTDYLPTGLNLTDGAWAQSGSLVTRTIAGPIAANGGTATVTISFQIGATFQGTSINNFAEISRSDNALNLDDVDSPEDQDNTNDAGGQPNSPADDFVDGNGTGTPGDGVAATDEDNHDGAQIEVGQRYDLALAKSVTSSAPYTQGSTVSYDITVTNEGS